MAKCIVFNVPATIRSFSMDVSDQNKMNHLRSSVVLLPMLVVIPRQPVGVVVFLGNFSPSVERPSLQQLFHVHGDQCIADANPVDSTTSVI